jgi:YHS domain-containing protein
MDEPAYTFTIRIPKRRLRFSVRSLLLLMVCLAVALLFLVKRPAPAVARLAMDGYCPVTLAKRMQWIQGDPRYQVTYRGAIYHLAGRVEQDQFERDRRQFAPVMGCADVVVAKKTGRITPGLRRYGYLYGGRCFLFADAASMSEFQSNPDEYRQFASEWEKLHYR